MVLYFQVYPIVGFPEQEICDASKRGIEDHIRKFSPTCRILLQVNSISEMFGMTTVAVIYLETLLSWNTVLFMLQAKHAQKIYLFEHFYDCLEKYKE